MKYEGHQQGHRLEAVGALHGYRFRICTLAIPSLVSWPVSVHVRGSESEPEVKVDSPRHDLRSATEALDYGYDCARLWIEAMDHHGYLGEGEGGRIPSLAGPGRGDSETR
jgi:hypothetical protein